VVFETFDAGVANDEAIRIRTRLNSGFGRETPVRVASKEVLVDEDTYRRGLPSYPR
jgi:hypothetical protein